MFGYKFRWSDVGYLAIGTAMCAAYAWYADNWRAFFYAAATGIFGYTAVYLMGWAFPVIGKFIKHPDEE